MIPTARSRATPSTRFHERQAPGWPVAEPASPHDRDARHEAGRGRPRPAPRAHGAPGRVARRVRRVRGGDRSGARRRRAATRRADPPRGVAARRRGMGRLPGARRRLPPEGAPGGEAADRLALARRGPRARGARRRRRPARRPRRLVRGDLRPLRDRLAVAGASNSLARVVLKHAAPGVPDVYRGCERWDLSLADPDNRRPVDHAAATRRSSSPGRPPNPIRARCSRRGGTDGSSSGAPRARWPRVAHVRTSSWPVSTDPSRFVGAMRTRSSRSPRARGPVGRGGRRGAPSGSPEPAGSRPVPAGTTRGSSCRAPSGPGATLCSPRRGSGDPDGGLVSTILAELPAALLLSD